MKNVKKLSWGLLALCLAFSLAFVGCKKATDGNTTDSGNDEVEGSDPEMGTGEGNETSNPVDNPTEDKDVTAVIEGAEITIAAGETVKVKADKKIEYDADLPAGVTIENKDGIFTIVVAEDAVDGQFTLNLYADENDDGINVTVKITNTTFFLPITLDDETAEKAATITLTYGNEENNTFETIEVPYTAKAKTAVAKLKKELANDYNWFNKTSVVVKDADGNEIKVDLTPAFFQYTNTTFEGITISAAVEAKTFKIEFDGFEIPGGSVEALKYSTKCFATRAEWEDETTVSPAVTVAEDGKSASFAVANTTEFYIDWTAVAIRKADGTTITLSAGNTEPNKWYGFTGDVWSNTLSYVSGEYEALVTDKAFDANGSAYIQIIPAADFSGLSISAIKVSVEITAASEWWASASSAAAYEEETYQVLDWSEAFGGYTGIITAESFINALAENGLFLNVKEDATGKVSVEYIAK